MTPSTPHSQARFLPGAMVAGRYRVVALLGRGGMGEVYRADDTKLGETVALKFLPERLENDASLRERFLVEARLARQVAHPNICRVYDVGEVSGRLFLSMEYVDGEDLATLLRRIGRLPEDKAVQIAHEICAGLHAAHEQGILHRDLKPSNVMLDGRGRARITDFGLAALAGDVETGDVAAGTPAYMAPEQLMGREVTVRSDVYALGLVLYELFSGRPAFEAAGWAEQLRLKQSSTPSALSQVMPGLDPAIERVVLRCLQPDPQQRPPGAAAVAMALPGGDPLAAALAAGETPSPEMVAGAGGEEVFAPRVAWGWFAVFVAVLVATFVVASRFYLIQRVPIEKPPAVLADRAREIAKTLGWTEPPADESTLLLYDRMHGDDVMQRFGSAALVEHLSRYPAGTFTLLYRRSPVAMRPLSDFTLAPSQVDPPLTTPGMLMLRVDGSGRLFSFEACPPDRDTVEASTPTPVDWPAIFALAGLDTAGFTPATPQWAPRTFADQRLAWIGRVPGDSALAMRIEAASYRGRPVSFRPVFAWTKPQRITGATGGGAMGWIIWAVFLTLLFTAAWAARRNLRSGRADARGALRMGVVAAVILFARQWLGVHVANDPQWLFVRFLRSVGYGALFFLVTSTLYLVLEPVVRRTWPQVLVSWMRLLDGRWRDRRLARDVLAGLAVGPLLVLLQLGVALAISRLWKLPMGSELVDVPSVQTDAVMGTGAAISVVLLCVTVALQSALTGAAFMALFTTMTKRKTLSLLLAGALMVLLSPPAGTPVVISYALLVVVIAALLVLLVRFGFVTLLVAFTASSVLSLLPLAAPGSSWYWPTTAVGLVFLLALALWSLRAMLATGPTPAPAGLSVLPGRSAWTPRTGTAVVARPTSGSARGERGDELSQAPTEFSPRPNDAGGGPTQVTPKPSGDRPRD